MEKITSKSNNLIKETRKLLTSKKERYSCKKFVLEGARLCFDVINSNCELETLLVTDSALSKYSEKCNKLIEKCTSSYLISDEVSIKLSETETPQGIFAICKMNDNVLNIKDNSKYILLDNIQDPSNLGAIIRTAEALGIDGAICYECCDVFNSKCLRASMGGVLRFPILQCDDLIGIINELKSIGYNVLSTVPDKSAIDITTIDFSCPNAIVIGNEGNGVSKDILNITEKVTINMLGKAESLNASMASAIAMWEMVR